MVFVRRQLTIAKQPLAEKLRALRRGQAVTLEMIEQKTHIRAFYLKALERGEYKSLPEPLYARNFIRAYARVLGADEEYFLELYDEECGQCDLVLPMQTPRQKIKKSRLRLWHRLTMFTALGFVFLIFLSYFGFQIHSIVSPPEIIIISPLDNALTHTSRIQIEGIADIDATVYVNGKQVVVDKDSTFTTEIYLEKGLNIVQIEAERRYSNRSYTERRVVFDSKTGISQVSFLQ